jgi:hypothetical protein
MPITSEETQQIVARLRERQTSVLKKDWLEGRLCPECHMSPNRQKCAFELGGGCPRSNPEAHLEYEENKGSDWTPYEYQPEPLAHRAAELIEAQAATIGQLRQALIDVMQTGLNGGNNVRMSLIAAGRKALAEKDLAIAEASEIACNNARQLLKETA